MLVYYKYLTDAIELTALMCVYCAVLLQNKNSQCSGSGMVIVILVLLMVLWAYCIHYYYAHQRLGKEMILLCGTYVKF
jgi:hypothetical protein